jgi:excisionase family DNA binding protein
MLVQSRKYGGEMEPKASAKLHRREEVAQLLGISLRAADELILTRQLSSLKIGKRRLVSEAALAAFIRKREIAAKDS